MMTFVFHPILVPLGHSAFKINGCQFNPRTRWSMVKIKELCLENIELQQDENAKISANKFCLRWLQPGRRFMDAPAWIYEWLKSGLPWSE